MWSNREGERTQGKQSQTEAGCGSLVGRSISLLLSLSNTFSICLRHVLYNHTKTSFFNRMRSIDCSTVALLNPDHTNFTPTCSRQLTDHNNAQDSEDHLKGEHVPAVQGHNPLASLSRHLKPYPSKPGRRRTHERSVLDPIFKALHLL